MQTRSFQPPLAFISFLFLLVLQGCGVMGNPIPYTQTESYRKAHEVPEPALKAESKTESKVEPKQSESGR